MPALRGTDEAGPATPAAHPVQAALIRCVPEAGSLASFLLWQRLFSARDSVP